MRTILAIYLPLHTSTRYEGYVSGGERHFIELLKRLVRINNINLYLLTTQRGIDVIEKENILQRVKPLVVKIPFEDKLRTKYSFLIILATLWAFLAVLHVLRVHKFKFTCVIPSSHFVHEIIPAVIAKLLRFGKKLVVYVHMIEPSPTERSRYDPLLPSILIWISQTLSLRLVKKLSDIVFVYPGDFSKIISLGLPKHKVHIMMNGVEVRFCDRIYEDKEFKKRFEACFMARISPHKGIFDLLHIWKRVTKKIPNAKLVVIGSGPRHYLKEFLRQVKELKLEDNIIPVGPIGGLKKFEVLRSCYVFVYPSYIESWSIVVYEALACGLPVITYDLPAYLPLKNFKFVIRIPIGDLETFSQKIINLLNLIYKENRSINTKILEESIKIQRIFNWDNVLKREINILLREY